MTLIPDTNQLTADHWMLFSRMEGRDQAAEELTAALEGAMTLDDVESAWAYINPVREKWAHLGACDSEPRNVVRAYFDIVFSPKEEQFYRIDRNNFKFPFV